MLSPIASSTAILSLLALAIPQLGHCIEPSSAEPLTAQSRTGPDLTRAFQALSATSQSLDADSLHRYRLLFIPGFDADQTEKLHGYFRDERKTLATLGLREGEDYDILRHQFGFHAEKGMENNAAAILSYVEQSPRPLLIISHSKGSVDLLHALLTQPQAKKKIAAWVSLQGAFGGTALADLFMTGIRRQIVESILKSYGGSIEALECLQTETRKAYMHRYHREILRITKEIPTISIVTWKKRADLSPDVRALNLLFDPESRNRKGDGIIETKNAFLPGSAAALLSGIDHVETIYSNPKALDRNRFLLAMLETLVVRAKERK